MKDATSAAEAAHDLGTLAARLEVAADEVVINVRSIPQGLKRGHILNDLTARVELVPFPKPFELEFPSASEAMP